MNLRDLRYLVALDEHRHFRRAAEACFVSQPTLSTQIKKLEQQLGIDLVERNPRQVMLTPAGQQVVDRARLILREADSIVDVARRMQDPEAGSLRIGLFPTLAPYLLPHVVPAIRSQLPKLELLLVEEKTETILHQLREGKLDVGVLATPVSDESLVVEPLFEEDFVLAVPRGHDLADQPGAVDVSVLAGESVLLLEDGHCLRDQALAVCQLNGASERSGFRATSLETLRLMVGAGVGVTLLPRLAIEPPVADNPDVVLVPLSAPVPSRNIAMCWRPTNAYGEFLPRLAELFRALPDGLVRNAGCPVPTSDAG